MVNVTIYKKEGPNGIYIEGFQFSGHAGFASKGKDIVCAGISALVLTTINSIEEFTEERFTCEVQQDSGYVEFHLADVPGEKASLLLNSLVLGVTGIKDTYTKYISLNFKEV
ncbi:MAG: ribosomal-processing cysteine protease Prp [Lachnospiraceae bacterium]